MKTIKEHANEYVETRFSHRGPQAKSDAKNGFVAGVNFATRWTAIEEELPEECREVLIRCLNGKRVQYDVDYVLNGKLHRRSNVTHWRYIEFDKIWD